MRTLLVIFWLGRFGTTRDNKEMSDMDENIFHRVRHDFGENCLFMHKKTRCISCCVGPMRNTDIYTDLSPLFHPRIN